MAWKASAFLRTLKPDLLLVELSIEAVQKLGLILTISLYYFQNMYGEDDKAFERWKVYVDCFVLKSYTNCMYFVLFV